MYSRRRIPGSATDNVPYPSHTIPKERPQESAPTQTNYSRLGDKKLIKIIRGQVQDSKFREQVASLYDTSPDTATLLQTDAANYLDQITELSDILIELGSGDPFFDLMGLIDRGIKESDLVRLVDLYSKQQQHQITNKTTNS